ncbi:MAG: DNRLRE domain-containing protein, partial [Firmicutes bacterium]|nr:DNRLRE domain-containing protein [Bacillota bacterium]
MIDAFYSDPDPDSGKKDNYHLRTAISLEASVEDSWVRKVTAKHLSNALVNIAGKRCTVQECTYLEPVSQISGGFRYPFYISAGQMNLVEGCFAENGRHDFVMGAKVPGPNVFYNSKSMYARNLSEPHHRFSVGVLYDNISVHTPEEFKDAPDYKILGNGLAAFNRGNSGTGHGWSGNSILFWNTRSAAVIVSSVAGGRNFAIGVSGRVLKENGNPISQGYWIYWFKKHNNATKAPSLSDNNFKDDGSQFLGPDDVSLPHFELETTLAQPESLYKKQLEDRLGSYDLGFTRIDAEADSYTCDGFPDKNYNDMPEIHLSTKKYGIDSYNRRGYLRFKLDDSIKSEHISSAKLKVHTPMEMTRGQKVKLYEITDDSWEEETLTWNNQPPRSHLISCTKLSETGPGWYNYDVTGFIKSQYTGDGKASFSMVIDDFEALRNMSVDRRESLLKPHLEIRYEINPGKPVVEITSHSDGAEIPSVPYTISGTATDSSDIRLKISDVIDTNVNVAGGNWSYTVTDSSLNGAHYFVRAAILDGQGNLEAGDAIGVNYPSEKSPLRREILEVSKDAYVRAGVIYADKNYGSEPTLEVKDSPTDYVKRTSYLNFDLSGI